MPTFADLDTKRRTFQILGIQKNPEDYDIDEDTGVITPRQPVSLPSDGVSATLEKKPEMTALKAAKTGVMSSLGSTLGGIGATSLALAGTAAVLPEPVLTKVGALGLGAIGLGAGLAGSYLGGKGQEAVEAQLPAETQQNLASDRQLASEQYPKSMLAGELATSLPFFRPSPAALGKAASGAGKMIKGAVEEPLVRSFKNASLAKNIIGRADADEIQALGNITLNAGLQAGIDIGQQMVSDKPFDASQLAISSLFGGVASTPTRLGAKLFPGSAEENLPRTMTTEKVKAKSEVPKTEETANKPATYDETLAALKEAEPSKLDTKPYIKELSDAYKSKTGKKPSKETLEEFKTLAEEKAIEQSKVAETEPLKTAVAEPTKAKQDFKSDEAADLAERTSQEAGSEAMFSKVPLAEDLQGEFNAAKIPANIEDDQRLLARAGVKKVKYDPNFEAQGEYRKDTGEVTIRSKRMEPLTGLHERQHALDTIIDAHGSETLKAARDRVRELTKTGEYIFGDETAKQSVAKADAEAVAKGSAVAGEEGAAYTISQRAATLRNLQKSKGNWIKKAQKYIEDYSSMLRVKFGNAEANDFLNFFTRRSLEMPGYWESGLGYKDLKAVMLKPKIADIEKTTELAQEAAGGKKSEVPLEAKAEQVESKDHPEIATKYPEAIKQIVKDEIKADPAGYKKAVEEEYTPSPDKQEYDTIQKRIREKVKSGEYEDEEFQNLWKKSEEIKNRNKGMPPLRSEVQLETPEFKEWFGDSKVVDKEGKPLVVYHTSKAKPTVFDPKHKTELSSMGFHFGTKEQAEFRKGQYDFNSKAPTTDSYFLSIKKPYEVSHMASFAPDHLADKMMDDGILTEAAYDKMRDRFSEEPEVGAQLVKVLKQNGYDGLRYLNEREGEGYSYVPFDSVQIKSATGNKGTFDPKNPDIRYSDVQLEEPLHYDPTEKIKHDRSFTRLLTSRFDKPLEVVLREKADEPTVKSVSYVTDKFHKTYAEGNNYAAQFYADMEEAVKGLNRQELADFYKYRHDMDNTGDSSIVLNSKQQSANELFQKAIENPRNLANEKKLYVKDGKLFRPGGIKEEGYIFNMPSMKLLDAIVNKKAYLTEAKRIWLEHAESKGWSEAKFNEFFNEYEKAVANKHVTPDVFFNAMRKAEGIGLPWELVDQNFLNAANRYSRRAGTDLSFFENIQNDPVSIFVLNENDQFGNRPKPVEGYVDMSTMPEIQSAMDSIKGYDSRQSLMHPVLTSLTRAIHSTIMGPGTALRNLVALPTNIAPYTISPAKLLGALWNMDKTRARRYGATKPSYLDFDAAGNLEGHPSWIVNALDKYAAYGRKLQGRDLSDKFEGEYLFSLGEVLADGWFKSGSKEARRYLNKLGDTVEGIEKKITDKSWTQDDVSKVAKRFVDFTRGTYGPEGLPSWAIEGGLVPFASIQRFAIEKSNRFYKDVVVEMNKGNLAPALRVLFAGWLSATAIEKLNEVLSGKRGPEPTREEVEAVGTVDDQVRRFMMLAQLTSAAGIVSDVVKMSSDVLHGDAPRTTPLSFPAANVAMNVLTDITNAAAAMNEGEDPMSVLAKFAGDLVTKQSQAARYVMAHTDKEGTEKKEKMRDIRTFEKLSGIRPSEGQYFKANEYLNPDYREFKRETDPAKAASMVPDLVKKAVSKSTVDGMIDPDKLRRELQKIKRNSYQTMPSPDRMPLTFVKYLDYLKKTQGEDAANTRLLDYLKQNEVNKAKSGMI